MGKKDLDGAIEYLILTIILVLYASQGSQRLLK